MTRNLFLAAVVAALGVSSLPASPITGKYVEARTCDVYTGACFANADTGLSGRHGVMAWQIDNGAVAGTKLDGLGVIAVVSARETLGMKQLGTGKAIIFVDEKANATQREALIAFVKEQAGTLVENIIAVRPAAIDMEICNCKGGACAKLKAGNVVVETRCLDSHHDRGCGNESAYYPPLARGVKAIAAMTVEHRFDGKGLNETWNDGDRRGAYVGTFSTR